MSYSNSYFTTLVNFIAEDPEKSNMKLSIKIMYYTFLNPGPRIILCFFSLFQSCKRKIKYAQLFYLLLYIIIGIIFLACQIFMITVFLTKMNVLDYF